jgi:tRNA(adenine34) deaminase
VIVETINEVSRAKDVTCHAELVAVSRAQRLLGRRRLTDCSLYTTVEPCPMCSMAIRETRIERVAYALASPMMGGMSKWNILDDDDMSQAMGEYFGRSSPTVIAGLLAGEAAEVWRKAHPIVWAFVQKRGIFVMPHETVRPGRVFAASGILSRLEELFTPRSLRERK